MNIDYDASVPGIEVSKAAPFVLKVDPKSPPGDRFADFIPANPQVAPTKVTPVIARKQSQQYTRPVSQHTGEDYISGDESEVRRKTERARIMDIAKEIYAANTKHRKVFKAAQIKVKEASYGEKLQPDAELTRAMKIVKRHKPITKEEAVQQATQQFYGLKR